MRIYMVEIITTDLHDLRFFTLMFLIAKKGKYLPFFVLLISVDTRAKTKIPPNRIKRYPKKE